MKVCLVSLDYKPYRSSGLTIYAEDLARGLKDLGCDLTVLSALHPGLPAQSQIDGVKVLRVPAGGLDWITYSWNAARLLSRLHEKLPFERVHFLDVHFAYAYRGSYVASLWQSFHQRRTAQGGGPYHTGRIDRLRRLIYYQIAEVGMEKPALHRADRLVAGCLSTRQEFITNYGVSKERIDMARQGIDTSFFRRVPADALRRQLGLEGRRVLLFMGFITPRKSLETLGAALRLLPADVHLVIAGRWAVHCRERFYRSVGRATGRVHEVGFVADEERPAYYSLADVYVSPSILEGLGITPIEAMACGTPAIVTRSSSGPEEVGSAGITVPPGDPQALADAICQLLDDRQLYRQLSSEARQHVLDHFTCQQMALDTLCAYENACPKNVQAAIL